MSSLHQSTWENLPLEAFERIFECMDDDKLLTLAKVNRLFNYVALEFFFGAARMEEVLTESKFSNVPPKGLARAKAIEGLQLCLRVQHLDHIHVRFSAESSLNEMKSLSVFIERLPTLKSLQLEFGEARTNNIDDKFKLANAAAEVCSGATVKGCEIIKLERLLFVYDIRARSRPDSLTHTPHGALINKLRSIHLSAAFIGTPLLTYTVSLLNAHSMTIRCLEFDKSTFITPKRNWNRLLPSLRLPNLESFLLDHEFWSCLSPSCLAYFLSRHPTVTTLRLIYAFLEPISDVTQPALPNLLKIEGDSEILIWMFQDPFACVNVQEVIISWPVVGDPIEALYHVAGPARAPSDSLKIIFEMRPYMNPWVHSITQHIQEGAKLQDVRLINLTCRLGCSITSLDQQTVHVLAQFVGLFPTMRRLELEVVGPMSGPNDDDDVVVAEKSLYDSIFQYSPNLESFTITSSG